MELTIREWSEYMEEPYKSKFKYYIDTIPMEGYIKTPFNTLDQAIIKAFSWVKTVEGGVYWDVLWKKYRSGELKPIDPVVEYQIF